LPFAAAAYADDFPKLPITMIAPFAAGGIADVIARALADQNQQAAGGPEVAPSTSIQAVFLSSRSIRGTALVRPSPPGY